MIFVSIFFFSSCSKNEIEMFECIWAFVNVFCIINRYFEYGIQIRCIWLYIGTCLKICLNICSKNVPEVWTILVRNICGDLFGIFGTKWSPYVAEASLGRGITSLKHPSEGCCFEKLELFSLMSMWKLEILENLKVGNS